MTITAVDIMTSPAIVTTPEANLAEIAILLSENRISAVPVCGPDGLLVGIVSEADVLKPFRDSARKRGDWWLSLIADGGEPSQNFLDYLRRDLRTAAQVMTRHVITSGEATTLPQLAELMIKHAVKHIPIMRDGRVAGIVSRADLVGALARTPAMLA
jgi:CBS domain-containing protein